MVALIALVSILSSLAALVWQVSFAVRRKALTAVAATSLYLLALTTYAFFRTGNPFEDLIIVVPFYLVILLEVLRTTVSAKLWVLVFGGPTLILATWFVLVRVSGEFRPLVSLAMAILTFEVLLLAQAPFAEHRIRGSAEHMGLDVKWQNSFRFSVSHYGYGYRGHLGELHGLACKHGIAYFWSYRANTWVRENPATDWAYRDFGAIYCR
jgi:hypothetical protein